MSCRPSSLTSDPRSFVFVSKPTDVLRVDLRNLCREFRGIEPGAFWKAGKGAELRQRGIRQIAEHGGVSPRLVRLRQVAGDVQLPAERAEVVGEMLKAPQKIERLRAQK